MLQQFLKPFLKENTTVLIIGNYSGDNIGDNAILKTMLHDIKNESMIKRVIIPSRSPEKIWDFCHDLPEKMLNPVALNGNIFKMLGFGLQSDIIVVGGGTIFSKYAGPFVYFLPHFLNFCRLLGKKVVYYSLGFEANCPALIKYPTMLSMLLANAVSVRDVKSKATLKYVDDHKGISLIPDPVLHLSNYLTKDSQAFINLEIAKLEAKYGSLDNAILCGFNYVKESETNLALEKQLSAFILNLTQRKHKCVLLTFYYPADYELNKKIADFVNDPEQVIVIEETLDPLVIMALMKRSKFIIAERLHSMILAHSVKADFLPIIYQEKCLAFLEQIKKTNGISLENFLKYQDLNGFIETNF